MADYTKPNIVRTCILSMQVCVPKTWTPKQARDFAEQENPCGTTAGWKWAKDLGRTQCQENCNHEHLVFEA